MENAVSLFRSLFPGHAWSVDVSFPIDLMSDGRSAITPPFRSLCGVLIYQMLSEDEVPCLTYAARARSDGGIA